ncbi:CynX/NimT family MFS transporter [Paenibacillus sepulcri]|uniref:MFS transporter n=1 Tax=Paenibacillus sepulcri TaxID=359917 RepID=A0ABS7BW30_9BACL|nr:MFS transporter [Paenibacillus sepulcri]
MKSKPNINSIHSESKFPAWLLLLGVVLIAANLRAPLTSVGPLIGTIQEDLGISYTLAGLITTLPLIAFALMSPFAPKIARKYGISSVLFGSMLLLILGIVLRSAWNIGLMLIGTVFLGLAIAICNVLMPSLIKEKYPLKIGIMIGVYLVAMNLGGAIASGISVPMANQTGLGWKGALGLWGLLAVIAILLWIPQLGHQQEKAKIATSSQKRTNLWKSTLAWHVTLFMGLQSMLFFIFISWLPEILTTQGISSDYAGWILSIMQLSLLPVTFFVPILARRMNNQIGIIFLTALFFFVGIGGLLSRNHLVMLWAIFIGIGAGSAFSLAMTLFGLRTTNMHDATELSGMAQSVGYLLAAAEPILFGYLHDLTNGWKVPLIVLLVITILMLIFGIASGRNRVIEEVNS